MLSVRLPTKLEAELTKYLKKKKLKKSTFIQELVEERLHQEDMAAYHDEQTRIGLEEIERGEGVPGKVVMKLLKKWSRG